MEVTQILIFSPSAECSVVSSQNILNWYYNILCTVLLVYFVFMQSCVLEHIKCIINVTDWASRKRESLYNRQLPII